MKLSFTYHVLEFKIGYLWLSNTKISSFHVNQNNIINLISIFKKMV